MSQPRVSLWHSWTHTAEDLILEAMDDGQWWYYWPLSRATRRGPCTLYPALLDMEERSPALLEARWETPAEMQPGQELRRMMRRLTQDGLREAARRREPRRGGWVRPRA